MPQFKAIHFLIAFKLGTHLHKDRKTGKLAFCFLLILLSQQVFSHLMTLWRNKFKHLQKSCTSCCVVILYVRMCVYSRVVLSCSLILFKLNPQWEFEGNLLCECLLQHSFNSFTKEEWGGEYIKVLDTCYFQISVWDWISLRLKITVQVNKNHWVLCKSGQNREVREIQRDYIYRRVCG